MKNVKVVSFDIGNTLLRLGGEGFCVDFAQRTGMTKEQLRPLFYKYFLTKSYSLSEAVFDLCRVIGFDRPQALVDEFRPTPVALFEDTIPTLDQLRNDGIAMVAISNCTPWEAGGLEPFGLERFLQEVFYSYAIGAAKPDPAMFHHVQRTLGERPENIVHVGDSRVADIDGATTVGWRAVLLDRAGTSSKEPRVSPGVPVIRSLRELRDVL